MIDLTPNTTIKKHMKPGAIVPVQQNITDGVRSFANNTEQLADTDMNLIINRDDQGYAEGKLFIDEGKLIDELTDKRYEYY